MENVIISDQKRFNELKEKFKEDGLAKLYVLADFDGTLTQAFVKGKKIASLISVLRDENYLTKDYPEKAKALYEKYHAIEKDLSLPKEKREEAMEEWWSEHFKLLIQSGLNIKDIEKAMESSNIILREKVPEFLEILKENSIPLIVLSSSGIGEESIRLCLEKRNSLSKNIHIISNSFEWDKEGRAIKPKEPIIHTLNKNQALIKNPEIIEGKRNIILLGNNVSDADMDEGFEYENILKIGFLNEDVEKYLDKFKETFDIVITNDGSAQFLNNFLADL